MAFARMELASARLDTLEATVPEILVQMTALSTEIAFDRNVSAKLAGLALTVARRLAQGTALDVEDVLKVLASAHQGSMGKHVRQECAPMLVQDTVDAMVSTESVSAMLVMLESIALNQPALNVRMVVIVVLEVNFPACAKLDGRERLALRNPAIHPALSTEGNASTVSVCAPADSLDFNVSHRSPSAQTTAATMEFVKNLPEHATATKVMRVLIARDQLVQAVVTNQMDDASMDRASVPPDSVVTIADNRVVPATATATENATRSHKNACVSLDGVDLIVEQKPALEN